MLPLVLPSDGADDVVVAVGVADAVVVSVGIAGTMRA